MCSQFPHSNLVAALAKVYWRRAEIVCAMFAKALHSHNSVKRASLAESLGHVHARARVRFSLLDPSIARSLTRAPLTRSHVSRRALARASLAPSLARWRAPLDLSLVHSRNIALTSSRAARPLTHLSSARAYIGRSRSPLLIRSRSRAHRTHSVVRASLGRACFARSLARSLAHCSLARHSFARPLFTRSLTLALARPSMARQFART